MSPFHIRIEAPCGQGPSPLLDWGSLKAETESPEFLWASLSAPQFLFTETALVLVFEPCSLGPKSSEALDKEYLLETRPEMSGGTLGPDLGILRQLFSFLAHPKIPIFFSHSEYQPWCSVVPVLLGNSQNVERSSPYLSWRPCGGRESCGD